LYLISTAQQFGTAYNMLDYVRAKEILMANPQMPPPNVIFHQACQARNEEMCKIILQYAPDVDVNWKDTWFWTPLAWSLPYPPSPVLTMLLNHPEVDIYAGCQLWTN